MTGENEKIVRMNGCLGQNYSRKHPTDGSRRAQKMLDAYPAEGSIGGAVAEVQLVGRREVLRLGSSTPVEEWALDEAPQKVERGKAAVRRRSVERGEDVGKEESSG